VMRHRLSVLNNFQAAYRGVNPLSGSLKSRKSFIMAQSCPTEQGIRYVSNQF